MNMKIMSMRKNVLITMVAVMCQLTNDQHSCECYNIVILPYKHAVATLYNYSDSGKLMMTVLYDYQLLAY